MAANDRKQAGRGEREKTRRPRKRRAPAKTALDRNRRQSEAEKQYEILDVIHALEAGNFSARVSPAPDEGDGIYGEMALSLNRLAVRNEALTTELKRVSQAVGGEGRLAERASVGDAPQSWGTNIRAINSLIGELARPTVEISRVIRAVAAGDFVAKNYS